MDRLEFFGSIDIDPVVQVTKFFEEIMAMYNLLREDEYISIRGLTNISHENNTVSFVVEFPSQEIADAVWNRIGYQHVVVYNTVYIITGDKDNNNLNLTVIKPSPDEILTQPLW